MAEEINEGIAYLLALKNSAPQPNGAATSPARETHPGDRAMVVEGSARSEEQFQGAEKRRSSRYKCEGSTEVREEGCDVRTWATFTDISLHGCYVEAQATYPAGTRLQLKLEANGVRVETHGTVRVNYPYLGMGISFEDMSEENGSRLRHLVATLSQRCVIMGPGIASSLPAHAPLEAIPLISDPSSAIQALAEFFENRQMLMRDDFLRVLKRSQKKS